MANNLMESENYSYLPDKITGFFDFFHQLRKLLELEIMRIFNRDFFLKI